MNAWMFTGLSLQLKISIINSHLSNRSRVSVHQTSIRYWVRVYSCETQAFHRLTSTSFSRKWRIIRRWSISNSFSGYSKSWKRRLRRKSRSEKIRNRRDRSVSLLWRFLNNKIISDNLIINISFKVKLECYLFLERTASLFFYCWQTFP